jgi:hypothetical protein
MKVGVRAPDSVLKALVLRARVQIEPWKRTYDSAAQELLRELSVTQPLQWAEAALAIASFAEETTFELPIPCTYDMQVAATKYLTALDGGAIPVRIFFNGTAFRGAQDGFSAEMLSWDSECDALVPVEVWQGAMDACFGDQAWLRVDRGVFDALSRYRVRHALNDWEKTFEHLLAAQEENVP